MNSISTLKVHDAETRSLIEKIKAEIKKRAEAKARRMLLNAPKKANTTLIDHLVKITVLFENRTPNCARPLSVVDVETKTLARSRASAGGHRHRFLDPLRRDTTPPITV